MTYIDALDKWSKVSELKFNASKCHVLHFGGKDKKHNYHLSTFTEEIKRTFE